MKREIRLPLTAEGRLDRALADALGLGRAAVKRAFQLGDVRVGGRRFVCMQMETPNGTMQMWFTGEYREVVVNTRLVYTEAICDEDGNVLSPAAAGLPDGHPTTTEVRVEFADVDGHTRMVMTHVGVPSDSSSSSPWASEPSRARETTTTSP